MRSAPISATALCGMRLLPMVLEPHDKTRIIKGCANRGHGKARDLMNALTSASSPSNSASDET